MTYFIDTGYILALELKNDQHHQSALLHWQQLLAGPLSLITTTYVLDEVASFLNSRGHHEKAVEVVENLLASQSTEVVHVDVNLFGDGWRYFRGQADKRYSLTDCISFTLMHREQVHDALAFDHHFEQAGFYKHPRIP
jgi:predicted nucleic acid-binding protein